MLKYEALKERMIEASTLALGDIDAAMETQFPDSEWEFEWRSVVGEDEDGKPIWSLHLYVEAKAVDIADEYEGESDIGLTPYALAAEKYLEG